MKVQARDMFTLASVNSSKKIVKPEVQKAIDIITDLMKRHNIEKVEV